MSKKYVINCQLVLTILDREILTFWGFWGKTQGSMDLNFVLEGVSAVTYRKREKMDGLCVHVCTCVYTHKKEQKQERKYFLCQALC
jgi:hypothetical protein